MKRIILGSNSPRRRELLAGLEINILPVDGVYYEWHDGDGLNGVSDVFGVKPEDIQTLDDIRKLPMMKKTGNGWLQTANI